MQVFSTDKQQRTKDDEERDRHFLMNTGLIAGGLVVIILVIQLITNKIQLIPALIALAMLIICGMAWFFARNGKNKLASRILLAAFLLVNSLILLTIAPVITILP